MKAVLAAPKSSSTFSINDLVWKNVLMPPVLALGTTQTETHLVAQKLIPNTDVTHVATPSHDVSLLAIIKGCNRCCCLDGTAISRAKPEINEQVGLLEVMAKWAADELRSQK